MYCPKCGNKQNDGEKFCSNCGTEYPNNEEYVRTIPTNKEKIQQAVEKGKGTANAVVSKGLEISCDLTKKASEQAKQIGEGIQATLNEHGKGHYVEFLKKHRIVVIGVCACLILVSSLAISKCGNEEEYYEDECYEGAESDGYDEEVDYRQYVNGNSVHITADFVLEDRNFISSNSNCFEGNPVICGTNYGDWVRTTFVTVPPDETWIFRSADGYYTISGYNRKRFDRIGIIVNNTTWYKSTGVEYHDLVIHPNDRVALIVSRTLYVKQGGRGNFELVMDATINR